MRKVSILLQKQGNWPSYWWNFGRVVFSLFLHILFHSLVVIPDKVLSAEPSWLTKTWFNGVGYSSSQQACNSSLIGQAGPWRWLVLERALRSAFMVRATWCVCLPLEFCFSNAAEWLATSCAWFSLQPSPGPGSILGRRSPWAPSLAPFALWLWPHGPNCTGTRGTTSWKLRGEGSQSSPAFPGHPELHCRNSTSQASIGRCSVVEIVRSSLKHHSRNDFWAVSSLLKGIIWSNRT